MTAPAVTMPLCRKGYDCPFDAPQPVSGNLHKPSCYLSPESIRARADRIDALTPAQMRDALVFLSGWTPFGVDEALKSTGCPECHEDAPGHTAQCTLRPGAEPVAVPVAVREVAR